jgi:ribonuclease HI
MCVPKPHFLLYSEVARRAEQANWRFVLESADGMAKIEATDSEPAVSAERLELLAVLRGLEALDQPSDVTLVTTSAYVRRGLRFGLEAWRSNGWRWERFGEMVPIKHVDLWQRIDQALSIHQVKCGQAAAAIRSSQTVSTALTTSRMLVDRPLSSSRNPIRPNHLRLFCWRRIWARFWRGMRQLQTKWLAKVEFGAKFLRQTPAE